MSSVTVVGRVKTNASRPSGLAAYAKAVRKYNLDTHALVEYDGKVYKRKTSAHVVSLRKHSGRHHRHPHPGGEGLDEVPAKDVEHDSEYVVPVTIGTPGKTLNLDFDTGSSNLWVWSSELPGHAHDTTVYNPTQSSTAQLIDGATWEIKYGDGSSASGNVYNDTIKIGDITIEKQGVGAAEHLSSAFLDRSGDKGLLGLAWPSINTVKPQPINTPVGNMIERKIARGIFSCNFHKNKDGYYTFGGIDAAGAGVHESDILYTEVDNSLGFWQVQSPAIIINGTTVQQAGNTAILDTGTTLCLLDGDIVDKIYQAIPGAKFDQEAGGYVYPTGSKIPVIEIFIGENKYHLTADNINFADSAEAGGEAGITFGGIQSRGNNPFDILGDVFLKDIYAVFDQENQRVGVAQKPN